MSKPRLKGAFIYDTHWRPAFSYHSWISLIQLAGKQRRKEKKGGKPLFCVNQLSVDGTTGPQWSYHGLEVDPALLGGGPETSRCVFQPKPFNSCASSQAMCQPTSPLWTAMSHKPLPKHLMNWGWRSVGTHQAPFSRTESSHFKAQIKFSRNSKEQSYSSS